MTSEMFQVSIGELSLTVADPFDDISLIKAKWMIS